MPSTIGKCKLFRIKHISLLEGETFLRNKHSVEKKAPLVMKNSLIAGIILLDLNKLKTFRGCVGDIVNPIRG